MREMFDCETEEVRVIVDIGFTVCTDHGHVRPMGGTVESHGIGIPAMVESLLGIVNQLNMDSIQEYPPLVKLLETEVPELGGQLPDRAKRHLIGLVSAQYLEWVVRNRRYSTEMEAAFLSLDI